MNVSAIEIIANAVAANQAHLESMSAPSMIDPDLSNVTFSMDNSGPRAFVIDGTNRQQCDQLGRALALHASGLWLLMGSEPGASVVYDKSIGRYIQALVYPITNKNGDTVPYADVQEKGDVTSEWSSHSMVKTNCKWTCRNRLDKSQHVVAYTKYHFLAILLRGLPIRVVTDGFDASSYIVKGYQSQAAIVAQHDFDMMEEVA